MYIRHGKINKNDCNSTKICTDFKLWLLIIKKSTNVLEKKNVYHFYESADSYRR